MTAFYFQVSVILNNLQLGSWFWSLDRSKMQKYPFKFLPFFRLWSSQLSEATAPKFPETSSSWVFSQDDFYPKEFSCILVRNLLRPNWHEILQCPCASCFWYRSCWTMKQFWCRVSETFIGFQKNGRHFSLLFRIQAICLEIPSNDLCCNSRPTA